jgi:hypothetical protein
MEGFFWGGGGNCRFQPRKQGNHWDQSKGKRGVLNCSVLSSLNSACLGQLDKT